MVVVFCSGNFARFLSRLRQIRGIEVFITVLQRGDFPWRFQRIFVFVVAFMGYSSFILRDFCLFEL